MPTPGIPVRPPWLPAAAIFLALAPGCAKDPGQETVAIHLVDVYRPDPAQAAATSHAPPSAPTEWRFDGDAGTNGWQAGPGVTGLAVRDGRLVGRTSDAVPVLHVERTEGLSDADTLDSIQVRLRVSAGGDLRVDFRDEPALDSGELQAELRDSPFRIESPLVPGPELRTYTCRPPVAIRSSEIRHVVVLPSDAAGATFEIESVRLVFRKELLATMRSGVSWQGLGEIYRECLISRAPDTIRMDLSLPDRPWLDLALGTVDEVPVTFRLGVIPAGGGSNVAERVLLERTVSRPHRWEAAPVDLSEFAGRDVSLSLSLRSDSSGTAGLWGSPVVRSNGVAQNGASRALRDAGPVIAGPPPQGVILIWADTLRRDHLDVYGYGRETAPTLRRMASEGTLFRDCVVQATWTKVSTPSLMTSLRPTSHGVVDFSHRLPASAATLAEAYRQAGYATLGLSSVLFVGKFTNLHQGFEEFHEDGSLPDRGSSKTAREYVDRLLPWIEAHRDVPFFVLLHVTDPHDPYRPYPPYDALWADPARAKEHERAAEDVRRVIQDPLLKRFGMPTRQELIQAGLDPDAYVAHDRDWYDGSIRAMDVEIGRLLERLRALGLDRTTLIVFTGDHGEEFHEHGRMFHGQSVYGELTRVPLLLWRPGSIPAHAVVENPVETIDLMPTLLELSHLRPPDGLQGRSLVPLLDTSPRSRSGVVASNPWQDRPTLSEKHVTSEEVGAPPPRDTESFALVAQGWKLVHNTKRPPGAPEFELYRVKDDPLDRRDLAARHPDAVQRLARQMDEMRRAAAAHRLQPDDEAAEGLSAEELERLRSLGYIQ